MQFYVDNHKVLKSLLQCSATLKWTHLIWISNRFTANKIESACKEEEAAGKIAFTLDRCKFNVRTLLWFGWGKGTRSLSSEIVRFLRKRPKLGRHTENKRHTRNMKIIMLDKQRPRNLCQRSFRSNGFAGSRIDWTLLLAASKACFRAEERTETMYTC